MPAERDARRLALGGAAACLLALVAAILLPPSTWRAWLGAAFLWASAPIGAIGLAMIMRLVPGEWSEELGPLMEAGALLLPVAAVLIVPVLVAAGAIYPWTHEAHAGFKGVWLSWPFFALRNLVWFGVLAWLALLLVVRGARAPAIPCLGLIAFPTLGTFAAVDWLLSIDPEFASSGFGLYVICIQLMTALMLGVAALIVSGRPVARPGILGVFMLCFLLMWSYFAFTHFFITWSDDLPPGVRWYQRRMGWPWGAVMWVVAASRLAPTFLLFFQTVRRSPRALLALTGVVLAGTVLEAAWLAFPAPAESPATTPWDLVIFVVANLGMAAVMVGGLPLAMGWRDRRRPA